ncbi:hypothetical protein [Streptomyces sp. NPDC051014]|uniref:hypothetical protein n=1 Tax=Streptomyces sp. NPDC051014 TaxID=3155751 RepID=UPI003400866B
MDALAQHQVRPKHPYVDRSGQWIYAAAAACTTNGVAMAGWDDANKQLLKNLEKLESTSYAVYEDGTLVLGEVSTPDAIAEGFIQMIAKGDVTGYHGEVRVSFCPVRLRKNVVDALDRISKKDVTFDDAPAYADWDTARQTPVGRRRLRDHALAIHTESEYEFLDACERGGMSPAEIYTRWLDENAPTSVNLDGPFRLRLNAACTAGELTDGHIREAVQDVEKSLRDTFSGFVNSDF